MPEPEDVTLTEASELRREALHQEARRIANDVASEAFGKLERAVIERSRRGQYDSSEGKFTSRDERDVFAQETWHTFETAVQRRSHGQQSA